MVGGGGWSHVFLLYCDPFSLLTRHKDLTASAPAPAPSPTPARGLCHISLLLNRGVLFGPQFPTRPWETALSSP